MLQGKKIILGITGSIAAYKAALLARLLMQQGAEVRVVMTPSASQFITPLSMSSLTGHSVQVDLQDHNTWNNHVELGLWADLMVIAPCTATTLAKMQTGLADNLLTAVYLSLRCPLMIAPAMDADMWQHPAVRKNIQDLESRGHHFIPVGYGKLASGLTGEGRMAEPQDIAEEIAAFFNPNQSMKGLHVLITSGPTRESLDPVRFITNRSSGKMGAAIAKACLQQGAHVTVITGPVATTTYPAGAQIIKVETAVEMLDACKQLAPDVNWCIFTAAVSDYRPAEIAAQKIKKTDQHLTLQLVKNPDIAMQIASEKQLGQRMIGFALETEHESENAVRKLHNKNLDCIVLNSLRHPGAGFETDTNQVTLFFKDGTTMESGLQVKDQVAQRIISALISKYIHQNG